jgi:serine acetyltransferase
VSGPASTASNPALSTRVRTVCHDGLYVGSNAVVLPEIGAGATIGAGAVVIEDMHQLICRAVQEVSLADYTEPADHTATRAGAAPG